MRRFKIRSDKYRKIIVVILLMIIIFLYFNIISNTSFFMFILDNINSKYEYNFNINNDLIYSSLNKVVSKSSLDYKNIKEVISIEKEKIKEKEIPTQAKKQKPIIYIYNTHESEKYSSPFVADYVVTPDVRLASYILKDYLNDFGIESFIQTRSIKSYLKKHNLDYPGSYEASRVYMKEEFKNNKYKILIDLHRDSTKHKYTLYKKDNKRFAKIMFVLSTKHKNYKKNEKFVNDINNRLNKKYNGITRGIMKRSDVIFNQDLSSRAILIELGGVDNTLEEINNTLYVLAKVLSDYVKEEL